MKVKIVLSIAVLAFGILGASASGQQQVFVKVNFQPANVQLPAQFADYKIDSGEPFGDRGNGFSYGWDIAVNETRERNNSSSQDKRYDTLNHMQKTTGRYWEIAVPNGAYELFIVCGDPSNADSTNTLDVEGILVPDPDGQDNFDEYTVKEVVVTDGRLTIRPGTGASNAKICFVDIYAADPTFNPAPVAEAGPNQSIYITDSVQLAGAVTDLPPNEGDPGVLSYYWRKVSGPGTVTFSDIHALDATVTFSAKGIYELMLQATDGDKDANDITTIRVKDRADEFLVGYWNFDDNVEDHSRNNNHGTIVSLGGGGTYDPDAAVGTKSINLIDTDLTDGDPNTNYVDLGPAPELNFGTGDWTVTGWFKTTMAGGDDENKGNIFSKGGDNTGGIRYTLGVNEQSAAAGRTWATASVTTDDDVAKVQAQSTSTVNDGLWHFAAAVRDWNVIRIYIDGVLEASTDLPANYNLSGTSQTNAYIGVGINYAIGPAAVYKHLNGLIDDVRVYNYALPLHDEPEYDSISKLTAMGGLVAKVDAGEDIVFNWKPGVKTTVAAIITDLGAPNPMTILWSTESGPGEAEFDDPMSMTTQVGFPEAGVYVLKLTVVDEGVTVTDTVQVTVIAPTCDNVVADSLLFVTDLDGDCYIGLSDLAIMLANWGLCNDPADDTCIWPWD